MANIFTIIGGDKRDLSGCEIYRNTMPSYYLEKNHSWKAGWAFYGELYENAQQRGPVFWKELVKDLDMLIFPRARFATDEALKAFIDLIDIAHELGIKVVYEVDDDFTNEDRVVVEGDIIPIVKACDAVTVTTPYLAELMQSRTGKKAYVLPNMISPDVWFTKPTGEILIKDKIILGLTGSATHSRDWEVLKDVLPKILEDDKVHLILMGYHPDYLKDLPNTSLLPGLPYTKYSQVIQKCDIVLAPLNNEKFNNSKSPIKVIEGMAARRVVNNQFAGAACISSNHLVYQLAIKNKRTGLMVEHTPAAWQEGLDTLIYNERLRHDLQISGHEWVQRHHDISKKSILWANAYNAILRSER